MIHSKRKAILALLFSSVMTLVCWKGLLGPFSVPQNPEAARLETAYVVGLMLYLFLRIRCPRERLWLGLALSDGGVALLREFVPSSLAPATPEIKAFSFLVWLAATVVSLYFIRGAFRRERLAGTGGV